MGVASLSDMQKERPGIEQAIQAVFSREDYNLKRTSAEHAGGKWRLGYQDALWLPSNLEADLNFMSRIPLWGICLGDSHALGEYRVRSFPMLDIHCLPGSWRHCFQDIRPGTSST